MKKSEFKEKLTEAILKNLNEGLFSKEYKPGTSEYTQYQNGMTRGGLARTKGGRYVMDYKTQKDHYPKEFWEGYFYATGQNQGFGAAYDKANDALTSFLGRLGYGRSGLK